MYVMPDPAAINDIGGDSAQFIAEMEPQDEAAVHPETLKQQEPEFISNLASAAFDFFTYFGWYLVVLFIVALYAWNKWLREKYETWRTDKAEREYAAKYHKNPDVGVGRARQLAMEEARRKQQDKLDQATALYAEIQAEKEEKRRREKEEERQRLLEGGGRRLGHSVEDTTPQPQLSKKARPPKPDYSPLDGSGGSGGYRPQARNCPGGGCGRR